jgi:hypothetical protein
MATHTVRLEPEAERALRAIQKASGMTVSAALKQGLFVFSEPTGHGFGRSLRGFTLLS